jgi:hypothetical protein
VMHTVLIYQHSSRQQNSTLKNNFNIRIRIHVNGPGIRIQPLRQMRIRILFLKIIAGSDLD